MSSKWRRFEVLLPLQFNDALQQRVTNPHCLLAEAVLEIVDYFGVPAATRPKRSRVISKLRYGDAGNVAAYA